MNSLNNAAPPGVLAQRMRAGSFDGSSPGWAAQIVLRELHAADGPLTAVNLAGRCFMPSRHVGDALHQLQQAGLVSRRGRRWRALERRSHEAEPGTERRRERRGIDAERRFPAA